MAEKDILLVSYSRDGTPERFRAMAALVCFNPVNLPVVEALLPRTFDGIDRFWERNRSLALKLTA